MQLVMEAAASIPSGLGSAINSKESHTLTSLAALLSSAYTSNGVSELKSAKKLQLLFEAGQSNMKCFRVPSFVLKNEQQDLGFVPRSSKEMLEESAARALGTVVDFNSSELVQVPMHLLKNLSHSLMCLVDARVRSSVLALVQQSNAKGNDLLSNHPAVQRLLSASSPQDQQTPPISPTTIVTTFRTLAFSEMVDNHKFISPLIAEVVVDVNVMGELHTVKVEAPGTISCLFDGQNSSPPLIRCAEMKIDTTALLQSMMGQARMIARTAITVAFGLSNSQQTQAQPALQQNLSTIHPTTCTTAAASRDSDNNNNNSSVVDQHANAAQQPQKALGGVDSSLSLNTNLEGLPSFTTSNLSLLNEAAMQQQQQQHQKRKEQDQAEQQRKLPGLFSASRMAEMKQQLLQRNELQGGTTTTSDVASSSLSAATGGSNNSSSQPLENAKTSSEGLFSSAQVNAISELKQNFLQRQIQEKAQLLQQLQFAQQQLMKQTDLFNSSRDTQQQQQQQVATTTEPPHMRSTAVTTTITGAMSNEQPRQDSTDASSNGLIMLTAALADLKRRNPEEYGGDVGEEEASRDSKRSRQCPPSSSTGGATDESSSASFTVQQ